MQAQEPSKAPQQPPVAKKQLFVELKPREKSLDIMASVVDITAQQEIKENHLRGMDIIVVNPDKKIIESHMRGLGANSMAVADLSSSQNNQKALISLWQAVGLGKTVVTWPLTELEKEEQAKNYVAELRKIKEVIEEKEEQKRKELVAKLDAIYQEAYNNPRKKDLVAEKAVPQDNARWKNHDKKNNPENQPKAAMPNSLKEISPEAKALLEKFYGRVNCTFKEEGNNLKVFGQNKKPLLRVEPTEVIALNTENNEDDYHKLITSAQKLFYGQEIERVKLCLFAPNAAEAKKMHAVIDKYFSYYNVYVTQDSKEYEDIQAGRKRMPKKKPVNADKKIERPAVRALATKEGPLTNGRWYDTGEIMDILLHSEKPDSTAVVRKGNEKINTPFGEKHPIKTKDANLNKVCCLISESAESERFNSEAIAKLIKDFIQMCDQAGAFEKDCTVVFPTRIGSNHFATYAFNTKGEILIINSMGEGYAKWDGAAEKAMKEALKEHGICKDGEPVVTKITPAESPDYTQKDTNICGAVTAAMSYAIDPDPRKSFADQKDALQNHMKYVCEENNYPKIRQEHENILSAKKKEEAMECHLSPQEVQAKHQVSSAPQRRV